MRIGIDARALLGPLTGIGRYTFELAKSLSQLENARIILYTPGPILHEVAENFKVCTLKSASSHNRLSKMVWSQTLLPYWASRDRLNLFWGPTHRLPRFLPKCITRVVTIHDLVWNYAPQTMRPLSLFMERKLMPEAIGLADLVIADSRSTASGIVNVFPQFSNKVRVVHLGISSQLRKSDVSLLCDFGLEKPYFLFVGTLEPRKNLERLLIAFSLMPKLYKDKFNLVIAGGQGWGGVDIEKLVFKYEIQDSVKWLGYVAEQQLAELYANAQFLAMPSLYEGFGLPLVEAMQYGTPVLTSDSGSMAEVTGDAGLLVDPLSPESISKAILLLLSDDKLIKSLRFNALRRAKKFSWEKCADETMMVFKEAIAIRDFRISRR
jgi:glycosyltransferase involved in cell wall biosynthesis